MYKRMYDLLSEASLNDWYIKKFEIAENNLYAQVHGIMPGKYVKLMQGMSVVMSDTDMEKETNAEFCSKAHGDIIIGGLGIGMIIMAIQDKPEVKTITVIEKNKEVIELISSQLKFNDKVKIVHDDVYSWMPDNDKKYDMRYMDIWNYINTDIYKEEMVQLKKIYSKFLKSKKENPNRFNKCWAEKQAKYGIRL